MTRIAYIKKRFRAPTLETIEIAQQICQDYSEQGFALTLRQLYYQFVAKGLIPNTIRSYKRLGNTINDARLAGLIDWEAIVDRTRNVQANAHWNSITEILSSCAEQFRIDLWEDQPYRPEVWIEKDALVGVIERVCQEFDVPYFACRGYNSQSEQWRAGHQRFLKHRTEGQIPLVLHLGDHDPSGLDMTTDNERRLSLFARADVEIRRLALNMDQIDVYKPPPNPAKTTDSRAAEYIEQYGVSSWELDALEPQVLEQLVREAIEKVLDVDRFNAAILRQDAARAQLRELAEGVA